MDYSNLDKAPTVPSRRPGVARSGRDRAATLRIGGRTLPSLPPGLGLIALREVVGMALSDATPSAIFRPSGYPGDLPDRRGRVSSKLVEAEVGACLRSGGSSRRDAPVVIARQCARGTLCPVVSISIVG